ncbi:MAG TPA: hypothetical protein VK614_00260 [Allosphingosinicella sp.]|nr:hypothetical protein [Allosphingosinicella sp.]
MKLAESYLSRRRMLVVLGGGALVVGAVIAAPYKALIARRGRELAVRMPFVRRMLTLANAGYAEWMETVGSTFSGGGYAMLLIGVEALNSDGQRPLGLRDRAFALHFNVLNGGTMAGNLIYTVSHPEYGPLQMFLSPHDPATPSRMLAVFN